jgi:hypothetical protein
MDQPSSTVFAAAITGTVALCASSLTFFFQQRSERKRWEREQTKTAYSNALKALSKATIVPTGIDVERLRVWFDILSDVREALIVLQIYCSAGHKRLGDRCKTLFEVMQENDYVLLATTAADMTIDSKSDAVVLIGVSRIRLEIVSVINAVTRSAHDDLKCVLIS